MKSWLLVEGFLLVNCFAWSSSYSLNLSEINWIESFRSFSSLSPLICRSWVDFAKRRISFICFSTFFKQLKRISSHAADFKISAKTPSDSEMVRNELRITSCKFWVTRYKLRITSYALRVTSWKLKSPIWKLKSASSNLRVTSPNPRVTSLNPQVTSSNPQVKSSGSRIIKSMKTQVNSFKSFSFSKIISPKSFGNSWDNSYVQFLAIISCFSFLLLHGYAFSRKLSE